MRTKFLKLLLIVPFLLNSFSSMFAQTPQGFSYQAVVRNAEGQPAASQVVGIRLSLQNDDGTTVFYSESHSITTSPQGVITLTVGGGTVLSGTFAEIPWSAGDLYLKVDVDPAGGTTYSELGTSQLQSVPYAIYAENTPSELPAGTAGQMIIHSGTEWISSSNIFTNSGDSVGIGTAIPEEKLHVSGNIKANGSIIGQNIQVGEPISDPDEPLFVVRNSAGEIVFAVYEAGVRMYVASDDGTKAQKGGFAVGGLSPVKAGEVEYFRVTPDSVRIYIDTTTTAKLSKGGFAVGGLSPVKGVPFDIMRVTSDSTRIYVNSSAAKGGASKGGFAVGGLSPVKEETGNFMFLTPENYFIGHEAGNSNTLGKFNSFLGYKAGYSNTVGNRNTFMGYFSGFTNNSGYSNIFIGDSAGYDNINGFYNIFLGNRAGKSNISGSKNIIIGSTTGYFNETGEKNVFVGNWCGYYNTTGSHNVFVGNQSGWNNTVGFNNVFIGNECGFSNIDGRFNVFIGEKSGRSNTTGIGNVIIGASSGVSNTTGIYNVFVGNWSGRSNTEGYENVFIGNQSGWNNTTGNKNIYLGSFSGYMNQLGSNNIFLGDSAGYTNTNASNNIFMGNKSGFSNITGSRNIFLGYQSGYYNSMGYNNVFLGNNAGYSNTEGYKNVFIGDSTGFTNGSGRFNIFIGDKVGYSNTNGLANVIIGATAGKNNTIGSGNTFVGNWSGNHNVDGSQNTYIGNKAGWNNISGSNNIFIGNLSGHNELGSNKLFIENSEADSSAALIWGDFENNKLRVNGMLGINKHPEYSTLEVYYGNGSSNITIQGTGTNSAYSYSRLILMSKEDVVDKRWDFMHTKSNDLAISYHDGVEWHNDFEFRNTGIFNISSGSIGVNLAEDPTQSIDINGNARFRAVGTSELSNIPLYITSEGVLSTAASDITLKTNITTLTNALSTISALRGVHFNWLKDENATPKVGFIAQEVEKILPEVVFTNPVDGLKGVNYAEITAVLVEAVKEQQKQIELLKQENAEFKENAKSIQVLKDELEMIRALVTK